MISFVFFVCMAIGRMQSSAFAEPIETHGVSYWVEEKRVEELYYVTIEAFGFLNDVAIEFDNKPKNSVIAISVENAVVDGDLNKGKFRELHPSYAEFLINALKGHDGSQCFIGGVRTPDIDSKGAVVGEEQTTIVLFDNRKNTLEEQLVCLYIGTLVGLGASPDRLEFFATLDAKELAKTIINRDF